MKKMLSVVLALAMMLSLMAGCTPSTSAQVDADPTQPPAASAVNEQEVVGSATEIKNEAVDGGTLTLSMDKAPTSLDPLKISGYNAFVLTTQMGDPLVAHDASGSGEYLPSLATKWDVSEDGLQWVFQLRDDVHFQKGTYQDGRLMTAEDVAYSINRNKQHVNNTLSFVDEVKATGENEVTFYLNRPTATLLYELTLAYYMIVPKEEVEGWGDDFGMHFCSTGPFMLESHEIDQQTVLVRNENYWGERPHLDKVIFKVIQDGDQRVNALLTGEIDIALSLPTDSLERVVNSENLDLISLNKVQMNSIAFSLENGPLTDPKVREALILATDRQELVDGAFAAGTAAVTKLPLCSNSWLYSEELEGKVPDFDPEKAKAVLAESAYPDGFDITLSYASSVERDRVGVILQQQWKKYLNVNVILDGTETATYNDLVHTGNGELYMGGLTASTSDPHFSLGYAFDSAKAHASYNPGPYINEKADELIYKALATTDHSERAAIYGELLDLVMADYPGIWFADQFTFWGVRKGVHMEDFDNWFLICNGFNYNAWKEN